MGWVYEDLDEEHEGWAAPVTADGRLGGGSTSEGIVVAGTVRAQEPRWGALASWAQREVVPWERVTGWRTACACGWLGRTWERAATIPGEYGGKDPDDAFLPDGTTVENAAVAEWGQHVAPLRRLGAVREAAETAAAARRQLDHAVAEARSGPAPVSWAEIGRATGMSRQSAHERWSALVEVPAVQANGPRA